MPYDFLFQAMQMYIALVGDFGLWLSLTHEPLLFCNVFFVIFLNYSVLVKAFLREVGLSVPFSAFFVLYLFFSS